jgi:hypothetical protein
MDSPAAGEKEEAERKVVEELCRYRGWWSAGASVESRVPPEPDVIFRAADGAITAFEVVRLVDQGYAWTMRSDSALKEAFYEALAELPLLRQSRFQEQFSNADVSISFRHGLTERRRVQAIDRVFEFLEALPAHWSGIELQPSALAPEVTQIIVNRGRFNGPLFDVSSGGWMGDPTVDLIRGKFRKQYKTPHRVELLGYVGANPTFPPDVWTAALREYLGTIDPLPFARITVFDVATQRVVLEYPAS